MKKEVQHASPKAPVVARGEGENTEEGKEPAPMASQEDEQTTAREPQP